VIPNNIIKLRNNKLVFFVYNFRIFPTLPHNERKYYKFSSSIFVNLEVLLGRNSRNKRTEVLCPLASLWNYGADFEKKIIL